MAPPRPPLSIVLPPNFEYHNRDGQLPKTPEQRDDDEDMQSTMQPPPPPRQQFKVKRKRGTRLSDGQTMTLPTSVIPTIEMSEAPVDMSSPTLPTSPSAHLLSPVPIATTLPRAVTPPKTPLPRFHPIYSQTESPAEEWGLINDTTRPFERATSVCSSFSDSSLSSCGSSAFSLPNSNYDSPESENTDPFVDDCVNKNETPTQASESGYPLPKSKRVKTRRDVKWTPQMDEHLMLTFSARLSDPTLTPFKMLPGSHPPMGVCDQVATAARKTWPLARKSVSDDQACMSIEAVLDTNRMERDGSPDTIRPSSLATVQPKWPKVAATRRRLRELCARTPSISAHYQRMLRTRSPSPFESSSSFNRSPEPPSRSFSQDLKLSLVTSTAASMQPNGPLAQLSSDDSTPRPRPERTDDWFARIPRSKAHQKSASLQSELSVDTMDTTRSQYGNTLDSPFDAQPESSRAHMLRSLGATKSLGRAEFNGKSLDSPLELRTGAPTERRSRKRRFRSDEEKPKRPGLDDIFTEYAQSASTVRSRGFSLGTARATDNLTRIITPLSSTSSADHEMTEAPPAAATTVDDIAMGSRSFPRRFADPVPRLGSPFMESASRARLHNTFPRSGLVSSHAHANHFTQRLMELAAQSNDQAPERR